MKKFKAVGEILLTAMICAVFCLCCIYVEKPSEYVDRVIEMEEAFTNDTIYAAVGEEIVGGKVNITAAGVDTLKTLDGVGDVIAKEIIRQRLSEPFRSVEDIMKVNGIGHKKFDKIKNRITLGKE